MIPLDAGRAAGRRRGTRMGEHRLRPLPAPGGTVLPVRRRAQPYVV
jgi:hypothetical protein